MTKKNFLPARLVKGKYWYIVYYQTNPATGTMERFRETRQINRVKNLRERSKLARHHIKEINNLLPEGWPFIIDQPEEIKIVSLEIAVEKARNAKFNLTEENTHRSYRSICNVFLKYCKKEKLLKLPSTKFSKRMAYSFLDNLLEERKVKGKTYNNYIIHLRSIWYEMINREIIPKSTPNPWVGMKQANEEVDKVRRSFSIEERSIIADYIYKNDLYLFWAILLQYYCFLRPVELRRLRFSDFDLEKGTIFISASVNRKSKRSRTVTIPAFPLEIFRQEAFTKHPTNYLIFGEKFRPHRNIPCSPNAMNKKHKRILRKLVKAEKLSDIEGLVFYSWKYTGITDMSKNVSLINLQRQTGHSKPETTLIYYKPDEINHEVKKVDRDIFS